ncbi:MAG: HEAT repeat domain-containing protein [Gemmatimonadota bacterium]|nr:MAG: HEAT repeat domain-containing protein [Gemmatimonadota bacterium]
MSQMLANPYMAFLVDLAVDVLLKGTIVLGAAGVAAWYLRGASAAVRHAVWTVALGCLLFLPILSSSLPAWKLEPLYVSVETPAIAYDDVTSAGDEEYCDCECDCELEEAGESTVMFASGDDNRSSPGPASGAGRASVGAARPAGPSAAAVALLIWALGVLALLARLGLDTLQVRGITRRARDCRSADVCELAERLVDSLGIRRPVRVVVSDEVSVPLTWGVLLPVVILPESVVTWTMERKRIVLLHELAHVIRWDYAILLMVEIVCAVYWFNPLVWIAARQGAVERERACDDLALHIGIRSDIYATHLYEIARAQVVDDTPRGAFAMAHASSLARRVRSILARGLDRSPLSHSQLASATVGALLVAFPLASVEIWGTATAELLRTIQQSSDPVERRIGQLEDDDPRVRRYAAWALGELESDRSVMPLIESLGDGDADVRLVAAWALGEIKDDMAVYPLIQVLEDDDPLVREMAVLALGEIEHQSAVQPLTEALRREERLREPVIWALGEIDTRDAIRARNAVFADWERGSWGNDEVWTGRLGSREARSFANDLGALTTALSDHDPRMRRSAAEWLGIRGDERAVEPLLDALRDPQPAVRAMAIWALDEINPSRHEFSH